MDALYYHLSPTATHLTHQSTFGGFDTACTPSAWLLCILFVLCIWLLVLPTQLRRSRQGRDTMSMPSLVSDDGVPDIHADSTITLSSTKTLGAVGEDLSEHAATSPYPRDPSCSTKPTPYAFTSLCDRLVLTNTVWEQEKELKVLRSVNRTTEQAHARSTFAAFTDRLLLQNRIWQQERQISELRSSCERMKKAQESMITRTAEKMMVDVRKEGLVEDFVVELIAELEASKKEALSLRESYEREITEINGEWMKDYQRLVREVDDLKLGQEARHIEQELSSELETSLADDLKITRRKAEILEEKVQAYEMVEAASSNASLYPAGPCACSSHSLSFTDINAISPARRMSAEFDDDDTLADFSIASTSTLTKYDMSDASSNVQVSPIGRNFLRKRCAHGHGAISSSHLCPPKGRYGYDEKSPNAVSDGSPSSSVVVSRIPGTCHHNQVFFAPPLVIDTTSSTGSRREFQSAGRSKRPTLMPLKLSMWSHRRKDHRSPTSASARKALSPASRSRKRMKLGIWRP
ncbi:hypothetical protein EYR36_001964 [Pleurotus pulmonarius]|nr:hypothetical protein EYR36_001964 [Pleurotus pulmonarius]KAF4588284.1 hypothetical protein EYR38_010251 [Pleurotus pulmonarius]